MTKTFESGVFKPTPSVREAKGDATTRAAREIIDGEEAARVAKTNRLRAARLAHEPEEKPAPAPRKPRRKR